jgi:hypothetical protein
MLPPPVGELVTGRVAKKVRFEIDSQLNSRREAAG